MAEIRAEEQDEWVPATSFGSRLLLVRHAKRITVDEAAARCGLKSATWSTWEHGASPRNMAQVVESIHVGLGVSREWLMWGRSRNGDRATAYAGGDIFSQVGEVERHLALV